MLIAHNHLNGILRKVQKFVGFIIRVYIFLHSIRSMGRAAFKFKMFINCKLISAIYKKKLYRINSLEALRHLPQNCP